MSWNDVLINFIFALFLFLLNGWLGNIQEDHADIFKYGKFTFESNTTTNFEGNFFQKIVNPTVYLAIICATLQHFSLESIAVELWLVVPFFWVMRFFAYLFENLLVFVNWKYEVYAFVTSITLGETTLFFLIRPLIESNESVFLDASEFRDAVWFAIIAYLAKLFWDMSKHHFEGVNVFPNSKRQRIIRNRYRKFRLRYNSYIDELFASGNLFNDIEDREYFRCLLYAIMIYEDYCRPPMIRGLEYITRVLRLKREMSLGIMQYKSTEIISNRQSISLAVNKLFAYYIKDSNRAAAVSAAIGAYNKGESYLFEVYAIFTYLLEINGID